MSATPVWPVWADIGESGGRGLVLSSLQSLVISIIITDISTSLLIIPDFVLFWTCVVLFACLFHEY